MKCIDDCGWQALPNNLQAIERHLNECIVSGAWSKLKSDPIVVWREGHFVATTKSSKKEATFPISVKVHPDPEPPLIVPYHGADPIPEDDETLKIYNEAQKATALDPGYISGSQQKGKTKKTPAPKPTVEEKPEQKKIEVKPTRKRGTKQIEEF